MKYFFDTTETIPEGVGFEAFGILHILWIVATITVIFACSVFYRKCDQQGRGRWQRIIAILLICNEIFKHICLMISGNFMLKYLPLHLCSINIFIIAFYVWKPITFIGEYLYSVCIPAAAAALLFPSWGALPFGNFMHLHSFTIHILLLLFPLVLTVAGDISPSTRNLPKSLLFLLVLAVPISIFNFIFKTNFMFLMYPEPGSPLIWFQEHLGNHLLGYPVLIAAVIIVMHGPRHLFVRYKQRV